eukprot:1782447-Ditylum_brightwellii.AAC.1
MEAKNDDKSPPKASPVANYWSTARQLRYPSAQLSPLIPILDLTGQYSSTAGTVQQESQVMVLRQGIVHKDAAAASDRASAFVGSQNMMGEIPLEAT